jgi:Group II intron, maturase-specific domain
VTPELLGAFDAAAREVDVTAYLPALTMPTAVFHRRQITHPDVSVAQQLASTVSSKQTFSTLAYLTYRKLRRWAKRRHPRKPGPICTTLSRRTVG